MDYTWQDILKLVPLLILALAGAPLTQALKNWFGWQDRAALFLTGVVAAILAVAEVFLAGLLDYRTITVQNFPNAFFLVFSVATIYYGLLKGSESVLGRGALLKDTRK